MLETFLGRWPLETGAKAIAVLGGVINVADLVLSVPIAVVYRDRAIYEAVGMGISLGCLVTNILLYLGVLRRKPSFLLMFLLWGLLVIATTLPFMVGMAAFKLARGWPVPNELIIWIGVITVMHGFGIYGLMAVYSLYCKMKNDPGYEKQKDGMKVSPGEAPSV